MPLPPWFVLSNASTNAPEWLVAGSPAKDTAWRAGLLGWLVAGEGVHMFRSHAAMLPPPCMTTWPDQGVCRGCACLVAMSGALWGGSSLHVRAGHGLRGFSGRLPAVLLWVCIFGEYFWVFGTNKSRNWPRHPRISCQISGGAFTTPHTPHNSHTTRGGPTTPPPSPTSYAPPGTLGPVPPAPLAGVWGLHLASDAQSDGTSVLPGVELGG